MLRRPPLRPGFLPTIRSRLIALVLGCALPILIGYFAFARDAGRRERQHVAEDAQAIARALAATVDRDLDNGETAALTLASQPSLAAGDLRAFHEAARTLLRPEFPAYAFVLIGPDGRRLLDTRRAPDAPLPPPGASQADLAAVFEDGDAVTSGLRREGPDQPWVISIAVPVWQAGRVAYALAVELRPRRVAELLSGQQLPGGWSAQVYDNNGRLVADTGTATPGLGAAMPGHLRAALSRAPDGMASLEGAGAAVRYAAYARTPGRDWTVAITFPRGAAAELLGRAQGATLAGIAFMLAISLLAAWRIGGSIARDVRALTEPAADLGRGQPLVIPPIATREAADVASALRKVEADLLHYRTRLEALVAERTAELQRSSALLATVYATAPVGLSFLDRDLRVVMVNDYLAAVNDLPASRHIGRTLPELLGERGVAIERPYRRVLETGRPLIDVEDSGESPAEPGVPRHWICSYYPVYGPERELTGINAVVLDITERKRQEQRNRDNEVLFRALFESSGDAHVLAAYGAGFVSANQAAIELFGCATLDELLQLSPAALSPERQPNGCASNELVDEYMRRALEQGYCRFEWIHMRRDGSLFNADVLLNRVDIGGRGIVQGTIRDITARVRTDAALRAASLQIEQSERMIRTVTDNLPALVGYWDAELRCQFANRPYLEWLGRPAAQVIGHTAGELMDEVQMAQVRPYLDGVLAGEPQFFERRLQRRGGERVIHAWGSYIPDLDREGKVRGFYMLHADITELKRTQVRLEQALRAAQAASSAKSEFLANMSHEIRTPLNAIIALARLLEEAGPGRRERVYAARMQMAARSLLSMLGDVLDYSKIEAGQLQLEQTTFSLDDVLTNIAVLTATGAWSKGIEPVFAVAPGVPARLTGDPLRLGQVLLNLIGNAIKFTERGEVVLAIAVAQRLPQAQQVELRFTVRDTGIGIALEQQQRMFEAFSQADSSTSRKYGGTGLGLAISRRLVQLMKGELRVESAPGAGASFSFSSRFGAPDAALPAAGKGLRVLVADDNAASRAALAALLEAEGCETACAESGAAALQLLRNGGFDAAFIDSAMADLDGASVLSFARAEPGASLPSMALLAADPERERLDALAAGLRVDAILGKPFTPGAVREALASLRGETAPPLESPSAPLTGRLAGLRVLVVEDNVLNQEVVNYALVHAGATADFAGNGKIAVDMLAEARAHYDAVLMDLQMPVMDGFEAAARIRAMGSARLPIVALSANALEQDRERAFAAGMDGYIAKPIDIDELVEMLARLAGAGPAAAPSGAGGLPAALPASLPGIDLQATLPRFGGSFSAFAQVFRRFGSTQGNVVDELRALLDAGERRRTGHLAHRLRGVAANLGAFDVAARALEFEHALGAEAPPALHLRLARLADAMAVVLESARGLEAPSGEHGEDDGNICLQHELAALLDLLQNNNMKAIVRFEALRPGLARQAPGLAPLLAEAVSTLRFEQAGALLRDYLDRKEEG